VSHLGIFADTQAVAEAQLLPIAHHASPDFVL